MNKISSRVLGSIESAEKVQSNYRESAEVSWGNWISVEWVLSLSWVWVELSKSTERLLRLCLAIIYRLFNVYICGKPTRIIPIVLTDFWVVLSATYIYFFLLPTSRNKFLAKMLHLLKVNLVQWSFWKSSMLPNSKINYNFDLFPLSRLLSTKEDNIWGVLLKSLSYRNFNLSAKANSGKSSWIFLIRLALSGHAFS